KVIEGKSKGKLKFFHNTQRLFEGIDASFGPPETKDSRAAFWSRVAFYNFIQEVIKGPGRAPDSDACDRGHTPFHNVMQELQPRCVLFACKRLYMHTIKPHPHFKREADLEVNNTRRSTVTISCRDTRALGSFIRH